MTHINYYDKYIKYKNKYTQYKKQIYCNENIIGGGIAGHISFCTVDHSPILPVPVPDIMSLNDTHYIKLTVVGTGDKYYRIIRKAGTGTISIVYLIQEQEQKQEQFVIKFNKIKQGDRGYESHKFDNNKEGLASYILHIPARIKALYQGRLDVDFLICNFLGIDLLPFLRNHTDISPSIQLSLIRQLHEQLYGLNKNMQFHNDVKCQNIVVKPNPNPDPVSVSVSVSVSDPVSDPVPDPNPNISYLLSLIDYGLYCSGASTKGASISMCMRGCAQMYIDLTSPTFINHNLLYIRRVNISTVSTDYVGFYNFVIDLICKSQISYLIYIKILNLRGDHSCDDCIRILCLLCYISIDTTDGINDFLIHNNLVVDLITKTLLAYDKHLHLFDFVDTPNKDRLVLFLCCVYDHIHQQCTTPTSIVHITKLPKLLWDLGSTCLQPTFNLEDFNTNFANIFTSDLQTPIPITLIKTTTIPQPYTLFNILPKIYKDRAKNINQLF
jgi:hypothetical protein